MSERLIGSAGKRGARPMMEGQGNTARYLRPMLDMIRLHLRLNPGHAAFRQLAVQMRLGMERAHVVGDAEYELARELSEIIDQDTMTVAAGRRGAQPLVRRDPIVAMHRLGRVDAVALRAAVEIQQVADQMRDGGVVGMRATNYGAVRVDGGPVAGMELTTRMTRHPALALVRAWAEGLDAAGRVWPEPAGSWRRHSEVVLSVVVDRRGCRDVERELMVRNGAVAKAVVVALADYAAAAAPGWARHDGRWRSHDVGNNT